MLKRQAIKTALAMVMSVTMVAAPALANPGNGNGNGEHGNSGKNIYHGDKGNHGHSDNAAGKGQRKNYGKPDHVDRDISYTTARALAVNYGLTGYKALPPGIAKNLARGKPLPPGIAKNGACLDAQPITLLSWL